MDCNTANPALQFGGRVLPCFPTVPRLCVAGVACNGGIRSIMVRQRQIMLEL